MDRDEETGASYTWHRYVQESRWYSEDSSGLTEFEVNLSRFTHNAPIYCFDPDGYRWTVAGALGTLVGPFWTSANTIAVGPAVNASAGFAVSGSIQGTFSPNINPLDARVGVLASGGGGFEPNLGASANIVVSRTNATAPEQLNGNSLTTGVDGGDVVGGTVSVSNLSGYGNLSGETPTVVNMGMGVCTPNSPEPFAPFILWGPTWGESMSLREGVWLTRGVLGDWCELLIPWTELVD